MDVFFIHGVNKRREVAHTFAGAPDSGEEGDGFRRKYERECREMERHLKECCRHAGFDEFRFVPIYWGHRGVRFHFYESENARRFRPIVRSGGKGEDAVRWSRQQRAQGTAADPYYDAELRALGDSLARIGSRLGLEGATLAQLLLAAPQAVLEALSAAELAQLATDAKASAEFRTRTALLCDRLRADEALRQAVRAVDAEGEEADVKLVALLEAELARGAPARPQGLGSWAFRSARRFVIKPIVTALQSEQMYVDVGRFIGDSVQYFGGRGGAEHPGPIMLDIVQQIKDAGWPTRKGEPTVFITHSLGGAAFYDLFSAIAPELHFDLWVSVGSQLAYYEDAKLLLRSSEREGAYYAGEVPGVPGKVRAPLPPGAAWYNVYDAQDWLAFSAEDVFENVRDWQHATPLLENFTQVHTAYFRRPSFFEAFTRILLEKFQRSPGERAWSRFFEAMPTGDIEFD